uniref:Uncharacterized protein n=1 Tax=Oryza rufipogon TaxID=4529 RepID=A0A0E0P5B7_ORYRU
MPPPPASTPSRPPPLPPRRAAAASMPPDLAEVRSGRPPTHCPTHRLYVDVAVAATARDGGGSRHPASVARSPAAAEDDGDRVILTVRLNPTALNASKQTWATWAMCT